MSYIGQGLPSDTFQGFTTDTFSGDGSATTFTLSKEPFSEDTLIVVINNVIQQPTTNFTVSGTTLTIVGTAVATGNTIYAIHTGGPLPIGGASELDLNGASDKLILDADADTTISADTDDQIDFKLGGVDEMTMSSSGIVINEGSNDRDFRIESNGKANMFFVDGGNDKIGINTTGSTPSQVTIEDVTGNGGGTLGLTTDTSGTSDNLGRLHFGNATDGSLAAVFGIADGASDAGALTFRTEATGAALEEAMRIHSDGDVSIGTTNGRSRLEVFNSSTGSFDTSGAMGATATDDNIVLGLMNTNNSATHTGLAFETRTTGAGRFLISNRWYNTYLSDLDFICRDGASSSDEILKMRADGSGGQFFFGQKIAGEGENPVSQNSSDAEGIAFFPSSYMAVSQHNGITAYFNRMGTSGDVIKIRHEGNDEGAITVNDAGAVSISGFTGTHWSRLEDNSKPTILMGTIIESVDKMMDWYQVEYTNRNNRVHYESISLPDGAKVGDDYDIADPNVTEFKYQEIDIFYTEEDGDTIPEGKKIGDRRPGMDGKNIGDVKDAKPIYTGKIVKEKDSKHVYSKISDTADSKKVYGLFSHWDDADDGLNGDVNDFLVAQVGTFIIRVNKDVTVEAGDLLVSNGDGTAKKQDDDIIRSKTVAKVNSNVKVETYSDGSYTVPCTLHC